MSQNLILAKYFNPFSYSLLLIKSAKKFSFEPNVKDKRLNWFVKVTFSISGKNELRIIYDASWNQGHIQGKIKQWNIWERSFFLKKVKILLLVCSIKQYSFESSLDNSSIQTLFFSLSLLFGTKDKKNSPALFPITPTGENTPYPFSLFEKPWLW